MKDDRTRRDFIKAVGAASAGLVLGGQGCASSCKGERPQRGPGERPSEPLTERPDAPPRNLLFIMTDQQRFDALGRAGNRVLSTPNLDRIAREGVHFENAYTCCPVCVPARGAILTGHGIESMRLSQNSKRNSPEVASLPKFDNVIAGRGYHTEYHGKWHSPDKYATTYANAMSTPEGQTGKARLPYSGHSYRKYLDDRVPARELRPGELLDRISRRPYEPDPLDWRCYVRPGSRDGSGLSARLECKELDVEKQSISGSFGRLDIPAEHTRTAFTARQAIAALERSRGKRFSITCSMGPPHPPFVLPRPYYGMYPEERLDVPPSIDDPMTDSPYAGMLDKKGVRRFGGEAYIRHMISNYYGMVVEVDDWIGKILDRLEELGMAKDTLVVFTSDHGEMLGDHGLHGKNMFYEGSAHVPLLMRLPGVIPAGSTVADPVSHVNLFDTILDYLSMPEQTSEGRSLRSLIEKGDNGGIDFAVSEWKECEYPTLMVRTRQTKLVFSHLKSSSAVNGLYDLENDPLELRNLLGPTRRSEKHVRLAGEMKERLVWWLEKTGSPRLNGVKERRL